MTLPHCLVRSFAGTLALLPKGCLEAPVMGLFSVCRCGLQLVLGGERGDDVAELWVRLLQGSHCLPVETGLVAFKGPEGAACIGGRLDGRWCGCCDRLSVQEAIHGLYCGDSWATMPDSVHHCRSCCLELLIQRAVAIPLAEEVSQEVASHLLGPFGDNRPGGYCPGRRANKDLC